MQTVSYRNITVNKVLNFIEREIPGVEIVDGWNETVFIPWAHIQPGKELFIGWRGQIGVETRFADEMGLFA